MKGKRCRGTKARRGRGAEAQRHEGEEVQRYKDTKGEGHRAAKTHGNVGTDIRRHRSEVVLCFGGVRGQRAGPADHPLGRGGQGPDGQDHLSGGVAVAAGLRDRRPGEALRSRPARAGDQRGAADPGGRTLHGEVGG